MLFSEAAAIEKTEDLNLLCEPLLAEIGQGNKQALVALYTHTKSSVYGFALSILKNPHMAEDAMQDTYIRIYQNAHAYKPQGKPMAWVLTIVKNIARMKLRSTRETAELQEANTLYSEDFSSTTVDNIVLQMALSNLAEEERQIVILHSVSGLKHREIADILEMPLSTVLSKYQRSLSKLKDLLKEETL